MIRLLSLACLVFGLLACGEDGAGDYEGEVALPGDTVAAGYGEGSCFLPTEAETEDASHPDHVVGDGTPASCTGKAFREAVAQGGVITFHCGPDPVTIEMDEPARVYNDADSVVVIDGGGLVTLSGGGVSRILYMNTCDPDLHWTTSHCDDQDHPRLTVQHITFINGNARNAKNDDLGGGAIWARGGRLKIVDSRFYHNVCASSGSDVGGGAVRVFDQYADKPVYVVSSVFGGADSLGNSGANGGALSSIGVSWTLVNSTFSYNRATGKGGNAGQGGSGGALYNDGNYMELNICGSRLENNTVNAYGSAIFFVSNDHSGRIDIENSYLGHNTGGSWYPRYTGISMHEDTPISLVNTVVEE